MKILLTGANGFLGWHTRLRLHAKTEHEVYPVGRGEWPRLAEFVGDADVIIHLAGVNRAATSAAVETGNVKLAEDLAAGIAGASHPVRVIYANSTQSETDSAYGVGKKRAAEVLADAVAANGGTLVDAVLPNIFGEHGRPHYNSFIATFVAAVIAGEEPTINDNQVELIHAQRVAQHLIDALEGGQTTIRPRGATYGVRDVWHRLQNFHQIYIPHGEIPDLSDSFAVDLFNTYRSGLFPHHYPIRLVPHTDHRGTFVETVRCRGGEGQSSFSSTAPGITRGDHYHLHKIERFAVISGSAVIELRRMFSDEILSFAVTGKDPVAIDMPVGWVHNIRNTGDETLYTQFWSHELFRPDAADTYPEKVRKNERTAS